MSDRRYRRLQRALAPAAATAASIVALVVTGIPRDASGDEEPTSAAEVSAAPLPGNECGRTDPHDTSPSTVRRIARTSLFVPRVALELAFAPIRAGIYMTEKYYVYDHLYDLFFDDTRTMGVYPTFDVESGFGGTAGVKAVHRDLFGAREHAAIDVAFGGRYRERVASSLRSGRRFRRVTMELQGELDRRPEEPYYGIGADGGTQARFRQQLARGALAIDTRVAPHFHVRLFSSIADLDFARSDATAAIDELYAPEMLAGFEGFRQGYAELELSWDDRAAQEPWDPAALHSRGTFANVFAGRAAGIDASFAYNRVGFDLQHYWRIGEGPRTLIARLVGEAVDSAHGDIPFTELPMLGGKRLLRGYPPDRFRDRAAVLGALEYQWDLSRRISASVFADTGRVAHALSDLDGGDLAVGYGVGIQLHTSQTFLARASIASSIEGGVQLAFSFDPVFDSPARTQRR